MGFPSAAVPYETRVAWEVCVFIVPGCIPSQEVVQAFGINVRKPSHAANPADVLASLTINVFVGARYGFTIHVHTPVSSFQGAFADIILRFGTSMYVVVAPII